ncbi:magnesium chelatase domain-containing protein [Vibrio cincinnatiensis]|uniref:magnesium chelatase domain-containing protein n=1 Tax=Vibrio cincinnatiensis TaxID=675 RepID=UPI003B97F805
MGLAIIHSRASIGVQAPAVTVEVHISNGMPGFNLVGLPETTVKESRDRVRSAIINSRFEFPAKRITVLRKINRNKIEPLLCIEF